MIRSDTRPADVLTESRLGAYLSAALRPIPILMGLTAAGLAIIYLLGLLGLLERIGWQLLAVAILFLADALAHRQVVLEAQRGRGLRAFALHAAVTTLVALGLAALWEGITLVAILAAWIAPSIAYPARLPRRPFTMAVAASALATALIVVLAFNPVLPRLESTSTGSVASLLLIASVLVMSVMLVLATQVLRYRTLQGRLATSLMPIIGVPILFTTVIAAYNAFTSAQQQYSNSLVAVSSLKQGQLEDIVGEVTADLGSIQHGSQEAPNIMHVLRRPDANDDEYRLNASLAANQIRNVIVLHPAADYEEILVLNNKGDVVLSTYLLNQGVSFANQDFFHQGLIGPTTQFLQYPGAQNTTGEYRLVGAVPFYGSTEDEVLGVVVGVARPDPVLAILQPAMGLEDVSTYLVNTDLRPVTASGAESRPVSAAAITGVLAAQAGSGSSTYRNHAGVPVLGYYSWYPSLRAAVVSEVPQSAVFGRSLAAGLTSGLIGVMTIVIAAITVVAASRAISEPVAELVTTSEQLASGQLNARAATGRTDEIGRLAESFNTMAGQLQAIIGSLEQRVAERTRALEQQTLRLRTAAEVARDASLAPTLEELLERASRFVLERFGVDDAAIYLLDEKRQNAVLRAAPSIVGKQMLDAGYRVAVGARNAVGQAADTGESQLALRGHGAIEPGDQFHPGTQTQLTLPLRTNEGTIGLLDLQSNTAELFSHQDAATIQVLADQLAAAIERGRLLVQVEQRLGQLEQSYRRFTDQTWGARTSGKERILGYRYDNVRLEPITTLALAEDMRQAVGDGRSTAIVSGDAQGSGSAKAYIPIRLRGRSLGVIAVTFREGPPSAKTVALMEQAVERLATALENVRLLEDSLRRASKERMISEITTRIGSSISVRNVLQTAVEELGRALPGSEVSINFRPQGGVGMREEQP